MSVVMMPLHKPGPPSLLVQFSSGVTQAEAQRIPRQQPRIVRRGSREQGRALEILGHAIEYLVDSQLFALDQASVRSEDEAVQIMMRLSRAVFAECPEVITLRQRLRLWITDRLSGAGERNPAR